MAEENISRRKFLKGAAYAAPLVVGFTLAGTQVASALGRASNMSGYGSNMPGTRRPRTSPGDYESPAGDHRRSTFNP